MYRIAMVVSLSLVALALAVGVESLPYAVADCPETNSASVTNLGDVDVDGSGNFEYLLTGSWALEEGPSWVLISWQEASSTNVVNVGYTPAYLQNQACTGAEVFTVTGSLDQKDAYGTVETYFQAGIPSAPWASDTNITVIPRVP